MDEKIDAPEVIETPELEAGETLETPAETAEDRITKLEAENADLEEKNKQLYARVKKAEPTKVTLQAPAKKADDLSSKELYAIQQAQVPLEDFDEVVEAAKFFGKGDVAKGLQNPAVKTIIQTNSEHRRTANATNTQTARPGTKKVTDDEIIAEANKGNIPVAGSKEANDLFWARRGGKK